MSKMNETIKDCEDAIESAIKTAVDVIETETGLHVYNLTINPKMISPEDKLIFKPSFSLESK